MDVSCRLAAQNIHACYTFVPVAKLLKEWFLPGILMASPSEYPVETTFQLC
jgi:hypothetical protein